MDIEKTQHYFVGNMYEQSSVKILTTKTILITNKTVEGILEEYNHFIKKAAQIISTAAFQDQNFYHLLITYKD